MTWSSRPSLALAAALVLAAARGLAAQGWREAQLWGVGVVSRPAFAGAGFGLAWRDALRTRLGLAGALGAEDGAGLAGRVEGTWHFLLDPYRRSGTGVYGGGGLALVVAHDGRVHPALQLVLGAEAAPAAARGTFIEVGLGRGARVAVGLRWRKQNAPRRGTGR